MPLFSNRPFVPFLRNLVCSLDRLAVRNWFTLALDAATCASIGTDRGSSSAAAECVYPYMTSLHNQSGSTARYGTLPFFWIAVQRPLWVHYLLGLGLSVINCDLDIVWLNDARPHMIRTKGDLLLQGDTAAGLNSGFYLARPSERASAFFSVWLTDLENRGASGVNVDEQRSLNHVLRSKSANYHVRVLNQTLYPNGRLWFDFNLYSKRVVNIVHCNWVRHNKKTRLRRDNLWFLDEHDTVCAAGFDPLRGGCDRRCVAVSYCTPGRPCNPYTDCGAMLASRRRRRRAARPPTRARTTR